MLQQKKIYPASPDLGQITKFNPKMQAFKRVLNLTWNKGRDFFNWLSNLKTFDFLNGSENMRYVIWKALK